MSDHLMFSIKKIAFYGLVFLLLVYLLFPFLWALSTALKDKQQLFMTPATFIPLDPVTQKPSFSLQSFAYVLQNSQFQRGLLNSFFISTVVTLLSLFVGSFAAFAFGKLRFRGKSFGLYFILAMTLFPQITILTGLYKIILWLDFSAYLNMILTYMIFSLPFNIWVLTRFMRSLPDSLLEAALIDGASFSTILFRIFIPLLAPALVTTGLLSFIGAWNEYLFALVFTLTEETAKTVSVVMASFSGQYRYEEPYGEIMAAAVVVTLPLIALVVIFQKRILAGLTSGTEKG